MEDYMIYFVIAVLIVCLGFIIFMIKEAMGNQICYQELFFSDFPESFGEVRLFFISDIHKRKISEQLLEKLIGDVDIVVIGGDLLEKGVPLEKVRENIFLLKKIAPVYFVWGNNDYEVDYHMLDAMLIENGVKILDNTAVMFESSSGEKLYLLGVDDMNVKRDRLDLALMDAGEDGFKILVSHNPKIVSQILPEHNIKLVLSGHTHGGQIHLFGFSPYEKGAIKYLEQTVLLVSNGYGTTTVPMRLGAKAQTHHIILKKK